jgi:predicted lipoprotein
MSLRAFKKNCAVSLLMLISAPAVHAEVSQVQWMKLNQAIVSEHILPRYEKLALAGKKLEQATQQFCATPDQARLSNTQTLYIDMLNAWQGIQHVQFGPIELLMRSYTIQFWPDKKNLTSKQLNLILSNAEPASLTAEYFQTASIAVKGLPAMERMLFSESPLQQLSDNKFHCDFLHAISQNLEKQTQETLNEWQQYQQEFSYIASEEGAYENAQEATIDLMKAQVEPLEIIRDLKLLRPLGKTQKAKARRLENWRSRSSLQNIKTNIQTLHHMFSGPKDYNLYQLLTEEGSAPLANNIEQQFISLETLLGRLPTPLYKHINEPKIRELLLQATEEINQLHAELDKSMSSLQLQLGFNSRDGD